MQESVINFCRTAFATYLATGTHPERRCYDGLYQCKGGGPNDYCFIDLAGLGNESWQRLLRAIGRQDVIADSRFANSDKRTKHSAEIDAMLSAWCRERNKIEAMDILQEAGVPAGAVLDTKDLINDPELRDSGTFAQIEHPVRGALTIPAFPVRMSGSQVRVRTAPLLGADTSAVLSEWLGMGEAEIEEFLDAARVMSS
jgi:formyl-CoA transferase